MIREIKGKPCSAEIDTEKETITFFNFEKGVEVPVQFVAYALQEYGPITFGVDWSQWRGVSGS